MAINPNLPEVHRLNGWFTSEGMNSTFESFSGAGLPGGSKNDVLKTISCIKDENLGHGEKVFYFSFIIQPDYLSIRATVTYIKSDTLSYPACPTEGCNKKVLESGSGWRCEKCDKSYEEPLHRYILTLTAADHTGQVWLQAFNDPAAVILGKTANEVVAIKV
jgi:replication factor A1